MRIFVNIFVYEKKFFNLTVEPLEYSQPRNRIAFSKSYSAIKDPLVKTQIN